MSSTDAKIKKALAKIEPIIEIEKPKELIERSEMLDNEIKELIQVVEKLGDEGKIEESEKIMAQVELLKKKKEELLSLGDGTISGTGKNTKVSYLRQN